MFGLKPPKIAETLIQIHGRKNKQVEPSTNWPRVAYCYTTTQRNLLKQLNAGI